MSGRVVNNTMVVGIAVVLIAMAWIVRDGDRPAAPTPTPVASPTGSAAPAPTSPATPTRSPTAVPTAAPTATPARRAIFTAPTLWTIDNTGSEGIAWRDDCDATARVSPRGRAWAEETAWGEGTAVLELSGEETSDCADKPDWRLVTSSGGDTSWVNVEYLNPARPQPAEYVAELTTAGCVAEQASLVPHEDGFARLEIICRFGAGQWPTDALVEAVGGYPDCPLDSIWLPDGELTYIRAAPDFVNARFPPVIEPGALAVFRCKTGELQAGEPP